mmetsp:Transcript_2711/g.6393  ORF Transcript_2711/g.6393 Transcript_2711/m.6393 type:complete len:291 (+) Transcript_2711:80-952(+)
MVHCTELRKARPPQPWGRHDSPHPKQRHQRPPREKRHGQVHHPHAGRRLQRARGQRQEGDQHTLLRTPKQRVQLLQGGLAGPRSRGDTVADRVQDGEHHDDGAREHVDFFSGVEEQHQRGPALHIKPHDGNSRIGHGQVQHSGAQHDPHRTAPSNEQRQSEHGHAVQGRRVGCSVREHAVKAEPDGAQEDDHAEDGAKAPGPVPGHPRPPGVGRRGSLDLHARHRNLIHSGRIQIPPQCIDAHCRHDLVHVIAVDAYLLRWVGVRFQDIRQHHTLQHRSVPLIKPHFHTC